MLFAASNLTTMTTQATATQTVTYHTEDGRQVTLPADLDCVAWALDEDLDASGAPLWTLFTPPPALWGTHGSGPYPLHRHTMTLWGSEYSASPWALWDPATELITPLVDALLPDSWDDDGQCHRAPC